MKFANALILFLASGLVTGCATSDEQFEQGFGDSVRHMIQAQTYQRGDSVPALRGDKAAESMSRYRFEPDTQTTSGAQETLNTGTD